MVLSATPALAQGALHAGKYSGTGDWSAEDGSSGHYRVTTSVMGAAISSISTVYTFDGKTETWEFSILPTTNGFFKIVSGAEGQIVGEGYCYEVQCHYAAFDGKLEETLTFVDGKLYKVGSKAFGASRIKWQEALTLEAGE